MRTRCFECITGISEKPRQKKTAGQGLEHRRRRWAKWRQGNFWASFLPHSVSTQTGPRQVAGRCADHRQDNKKQWTFDSKSGGVGLNKPKAPNTESSVHQPGPSSAAVHCGRFRFCLQRSARRLPSTVRGDATSRGVRCSCHGVKICGALEILQDPSIMSIFSRKQANLVVAPPFHKSTIATVAIFSCDDATLIT